MRGERNYYRRKQKQNTEIETCTNKSDRSKQNEYKRGREEERGREAEREGPPIKPSCSLQSWGDFSQLKKMWCITFPILSTADLRERESFWESAREGGRNQLRMKYLDSNWIECEVWICLPSWLPTCERQGTTTDCLGEMISASLNL